MKRSPTPIFLSLSLVLTGCLAGPSVTAGPSTSPAAASAERNPTPPAATAVPTETIAPSPSPLTADGLQLLRPDSRSILAVCDPSPGLALPDAGDDLVGCGDGVELGLRAIQTVTGDAITRAYLQRPTCSAAPCSADQLATGILTAWSLDAAWTTTVDLGARTATIPVEASEPRWPTVDGPVPAVDRTAIEGAPQEVQERTPLPFCGSSSWQEEEAIETCFVAAVLSGRPAEILQIFTGTEGGIVNVLSRFTGSGAIVTYSNGVDDKGKSTGWRLELSRLWLGIDAVHWTADPVDHTDRTLP